MNDIIVSSSIKLNKTIFKIRNIITLTMKQSITKLCDNISSIIKVVNNFF